MPHGMQALGSTTHDIGYDSATTKLRVRKVRRELRRRVLEGDPAGCNRICGVAFSHGRRHGCAPRSGSRHVPASAARLDSTTALHLHRFTRCEPLQRLAAEEHVQSSAADWRTTAQERTEWCRVSASFAARHTSMLSTTFGAARCMADAKMTSA